MANGNYSRNERLGGLIAKSGSAPDLALNVVRLCGVQRVDKSLNRAGSVCLNSFVPIVKWFPALFMPRGEMSAAG